MSVATAVQCCARLLVVVCACSLASCATPGPGANETLSADELRSLKPEIAEHLTCVADRVGSVRERDERLQGRIEAASVACRDQLGPLADGLQKFNLTPDAQQHYLDAVAASSQQVVRETMLGQRTTNAARSSIRPTL